MKSKITITVGIPAYNEEKSILPLIQSVLSQKQKGYLLEKILVVSDGATDNTVKKAREISDPRITIINGTKNMGRVYRRNQIMKLTTSDVLVFLDGDCVLENEMSLSELLTPLRNEKTISLVGGNPFSVGINSFLVKSFSIPQTIYTRARYQIRHGNNIFGCMGGMLALRKNLYSTITIPSDVMADDAYIYFSNIENGYKFANAKRARILHKFPTSLSIHISRNRRHNKSSFELNKYFNEKIIAREFNMPRRIIVEETVKEFLSFPIQTVFIFSVNSYARFLNKYEK